MAAAGRTQQMISGFQLSDTLSPTLSLFNLLYSAGTAIIDIKNMDAELEMSTIAAKSE